MNLQEFNYIIHRIPGAKNKAADLLSRIVNNKENKSLKDLINITIEEEN